jgi:hypothetical protein
MLDDKAGITLEINALHSFHQPFMVSVAAARHASTVKGATVPVLQLHLRVYFVTTIQLL